uniref:Uncharacterized protein n=1 Tax=Caenorhabditis tropicalis TaxID=1561998 RepID=A0A1I7UHZ9_9PELO
MSGVYNKSGGDTITKASVQTITEIAPKDIADLREIKSSKSNELVEKQSEKTEELIVEVGETGIQLIDLAEESTEQLVMNTENTDDLGLTNEHSIRISKSSLKQKVQFVKFFGSQPSDWEDIGSQTDHSDISEGHYSDETTEERKTRELRNQTKSYKRTRRCAEINKKRNIM